jgi:hypothetical protein
MSDNQFFASMVRQYNDLYDQDRDEDAEQLLRDCPSLLDYDERGNYIGQVAYENGWTP